MQKRDWYFIKKFRQCFPNPSSAVIIWGASFKQKKNYRGHEPTVSAEKLKELLIKEGYKIFEVNEYNTSKRCHRCESSMAFTSCINLATG
jgi:hypothetical protein